MRRALYILKKDIWFHVFSLVSVGLIITSFFIPPTGVIDPSVFAGVGELFGFGALNEVRRAIDKGYDTKINHHDTTIEINNDDNKQ